jgi:PadR family transcriptional regulator PadR
MPATPRKPGIIQGTLDLLILRTLVFGPLHGHGIVKHIRSTTDEVLSVEHGSLYPALQRLEKLGCITSAWEVAGSGKELKLYRITTKGRAQLKLEESKWAQLSEAMARLLRPAKARPS